MAYAQSREDFEYLESIKPIDDMQDQDHKIWKILQNPTKSTACSFYDVFISFWFIEFNQSPVKVTHKVMRRIKEIAEHHSADLV